MIIKIRPKELNVSKLTDMAENYEEQCGYKPCFFMNDETIKDLYASINFTKFTEIENVEEGEIKYYCGYEIIHNNDLEYGEVEIKYNSEGSAMEIIDNCLHIERATNAFNQSFNNLLRQIEQQIKSAIQKGEFSCRIYFDLELPQSVIEDIKIMLEGANYDVETGCCSGPLKEIFNFLKISWATNEGKIKNN